MSVSLAYEPIAPKKYIDGVTSSMVDALKETFGDLPLVLEAEHLPILRAMANAYDKVDSPYEQIVQAIKRHEKIILRAEY